jgi:hypothetical protein
MKPFVVFFVGAILVVSGAVAGYRVVAPRCGDGHFNPKYGEECDLPGSDCCNSDCTLAAQGTYCLTGGPSVSDDSNLACANIFQCDGRGECVWRQAAVPSAACGDSIETECSGPDFCRELRIEDGWTVQRPAKCDPNDRPQGVQCADTDGDPCTVPACDGSGGCIQEYKWLNVDGECSGID